MGTYVLKKAKNGEYMFNLLAGNHQTILTSELYKTKAGAEGGISSVRVNSPLDARYERKQTAAGYSFILKAANGEPIGRSEVYTSAASRDNGIESVKLNGPSSPVRDET